MNATSLTYTVDACASSQAATGLNVDGKRYLPSALCTRQLQRTRKIGRLSRLAIRPQLPMSCMPSFGQFRVTVTLVPVILCSSCVFDAMYKSSCKTHCPGVCPATRGECATRHPTGAACATRHSVAQITTCKLVPIVLFLKEAQTSTLSGSAGVRARDSSETVRVYGAGFDITSPEQHEFFAQRQPEARRVNLEVRPTRKSECTNRESRL